MLWFVAGRHGAMDSSAFGGGLCRGRVSSPASASRRAPCAGSWVGARGLGRRVVVGGSLVPASDGVVLQAQPDGDLEGGCGPLAGPWTRAPQAGGAAAHVVPSVAVVSDF